MDWKTGLIKPTNFESFGSQATHFDGWRLSLIKVAHHRGNEN